MKFHEKVSWTIKDGLVNLEIYPYNHFVSEYMYIYCRIIYTHTYTNTFKNTRKYEVITYICNIYYKIYLYAFWRWTLTKVKVSLMRKGTKLHSLDFLYGDSQNIFD